MRESLINLISISKRPAKLEGRSLTQGIALVLILWNGMSLLPFAQTISGPPLSQADSLVRSAIPTRFVHISDPGFRYSEYVNAVLDSTGLEFDRLTVPWFGALHSPGTRIDFSTDAIDIEMLVNYTDVFSTPGAGRFRLEVDGVLLPSLFGSDSDLGEQTFELIANGSPGPHDYSLIWPYASDVKLVGLNLSGGSTQLLGTPPPRPPFIYVAYGDSITHGFDGSSAANGYPFQVGRMRNWSVTNMGFTARRVQPADGTAIAALGANCLSVAIGVNDYFGPTPTPIKDFGILYDDFLDNIRAVQPAVPLFAITPTWVGFEGVPNVIGLTVADYRQEIFDVVFRRQGTDPNLFIVEGPSLVPGNLTNFPMGIHPSDSGFAFYASSLSSEFSGVFGSPDVEVSADVISLIADANDDQPTEVISDRDWLVLQGRHQPLTRNRADPRGATNAPRLRLYPGGQAGALDMPYLRLQHLTGSSAEPELLIGNSAGVPTIGRLYFSRSINGLKAAVEGNRSNVASSEIFSIPVDGLQIPLGKIRRVAAGQELWLLLVEVDQSTPSGLAHSRFNSLSFGE
ncbi:MAG: hypothetical protein ACI8TQ_000705 [Planctomycetota bacterium]|jgi:hypothetical protein